MTDAERFGADLSEMAQRAATEAKAGLNPYAAAHHAVRWLKHECPRGRGIEPGWGGETVYLRRGKGGMLERHRQVREMAAAGEKPEEIAAALNYSEGHVRNILSEGRAR